jgi:CheY-like chemotaxis protein
LACPERWIADPEHRANRAALLLMAIADFVTTPRSVSRRESPSSSRGWCAARKVSTILVVDDDPSSRLLLRVILEMHGHSVVEAVDGEQALGMILPSPFPDVVITDLRMPNLNGVTLIERLQSEPKTATIPIVVVSAEYDAALALKSSGMVEAVVTKPISINALEECIRALAPTPVRSLLAP